MTALENLIIRQLPSDWTQDDCEGFAKRLAPALQESMNAAIRHETTKPIKAHEPVDGYELRDVMPDAW